MITQQKTFLLVGLMAMIGGSIGGAVKIGVQTIPPFTLTFLRFLVATICMLPFLWREIHRYSWRTLLSAMGVSLLAVGNVVIFAFGIRYTTVTISQLLYGTMPVVIAVMSYIFLKEHFSRRKILGILLGLSGVTSLLLLPVISQNAPFTGSLQGNLTVLTAVVCLAFYSVFSKRYQVKIAPRVLTFVFAATAALSLLPLVVIDWLVNPSWPSQIGLPAVLAVLYVGVFGGAGYYLLYQQAIKRGTPITASMTMFLQPISAYFTGLALFGEKLIPGVIVGAVISLFGAWTVTTEGKKNNQINHARVTRG